MKQITVRIPATTANLGPGFDCLGLALGLYNEVTLQAVAEGLAITIEGEGTQQLPTTPGNLVARAAESVFDKVGRRPAGLRIHQRNEIPVGSGLGSSAAATMGGILAANALVEGQLSQVELLNLAVEMEHHPDNVVPALYGGLTLINSQQGNFHVEQIDIPLMWVVVVLPDFDLPTAEARAALPKMVPLADAIFNAGRVGLLVRALESGSFGKLAVAMDDRLHQPYRTGLIPGMAEAFAAARQAGAAGVALSGAGPSLAAFAADGHEQIAAAAADAFKTADLHSRTWILPVDNRGAQIR